MVTELRNATLTLSALALLCGVASAQQPHSWTSHDKIALSYYFYWYNIHDGEHFTNPGGSDSLTNHPPDDSLANYSYTDVSWHQQQMQDMVAAGIDVALPVYWGDTQDLFWSQTGLRVMVTALQAMAQTGAPFPGIGMFLDTTSLWKQNGLQLPDVTTPSGKATFYGMVHDFFSIVPKSLWATIEGRPILVLYYSSWVAAYDQSSLDYVSQQFQNDFGLAPYIIRERSWTGVVTDAAYVWGAALSGPIITGDTAAVGPGYDDSAILNRNPHRSRDRECGGFYQQAWDTILPGAPRLVFVETWNELHEATEVAATREYGRQYIDLTARNIGRWKSSTGFAAAPMVWLSPGRDTFQSGLRIAVNNGDGVWHVNRVAGRDAAYVDRATTPRSNYIYLDVDDGFLHAVTTPVWVTVEYLDAGSTPWRLEYDSTNNPYTGVPGVAVGNTGLWKRVTFALPNAYFAGRENGGSDLRIDDVNNTGETHYFSRVWITKTAPSASVLQLAPSADVVLSPGSTMELPLTVSSSDGSPASLTLVRAPAFASLQSRNGATVLDLTPSSSDVQACSVLVTIVAANDTTASLPDATSFRALVANPGSPLISLSNTQLQFWYYATPGSAPPAAQTIGVSNSGSGIFSWSATANVPWITVSATPTGFTVSVNPVGLTVGIHPGLISLTAPGAANSPLTVSVTLTVNSSAPLVTPSATRFVPITPCRIADTRNANSTLGGPTLPSQTSRDFVIPNSACSIPLTAVAYSLNVAVVPSGPLGFLTLWPTGQPQPLVATLNSDGRVKSNAAIVPAGANGAISVFVTDAADVVLDINGYFVAGNSPTALAFYPLRPCRIADTRDAAAPLGGPSLAALSTRSLPILASSCRLPANAQAYSLNFAAVAKGPSLGFLTAWPAGQQQPLVASLNDPTGTVLANAVIVPAGASGAVNVFTTDATDLVIDINGYFAPPGPGGLSLYTVPPCRVLDSRLPSGSPPFSITRDVNVTANSCGVPATVQGFVFNATVVPSGFLGYITMWPQGQSQPPTATLNAYDGAITNNMAIVPTTTGTISVFPSAPTHLVLDIFGYFAP